MRRWNGWGDDTVQYPLGARALAFLREAVGEATAPRDVSAADVLATIPPTRLSGLPGQELISIEEWPRLLHARGQSLPDWVALRSGCIPAFPDGVAFPLTKSDVAYLLEYAEEIDARVIPYGGGTSVVGHITPEPGDRPVLTINMRRMNQLAQLDSISLLATFGAGVAGPELEAHLRARGFTLGHFPQSFEFSTLGGWVATRSSGQQSLGYGRIESLFAGGTLLAPAGEMRLPPFPASAAGPDLRQLVLGSEGRLGILTDATVRITPLPEHEEFQAIFFPDFVDATTAVRRIVQARLPLSLLRLSTPMETRTTLALAGHERLIGLLETMLGVRGVGDDKCMLLCGFTGPSAAVRDARHATIDTAREHGGVNAGRRFGEQWMEGRFRTPYLRNTLWDLGYAVDTLETATTWDRVPRMVDQIEAALYSAVPNGERIHVFTHLSHVYPQGASIYTTYLFRISTDPDGTLRRWEALKGAASRTIVREGGTISHQHGVGRDHAPYLEAEKGALGMAALAGVTTIFDPDGRMNPDVLLNDHWSVGGNR
ncbi:MAG: FAD-binding oxidoreductase [Candidatus Promineofilum sp.]|uniref:FAD-binding oxidoreductase n=1 Tax=Promineifilum sp. TaxID=2664178 RepID=UPI002411A1BD|nr:FAD-binding oxidoreductase [Promineifilum sp.]